MKNEYAHPDEKVDIHVLVGRIDGKVDLILERTTSHETRLRSLEAWRNRLAGGLAILGAIELKVPLTATLHMLGF